MMIDDNREAEKQQKVLGYHQANLINMNILLGNKYYLLMKVK